MDPRVNRAAGHSVQKRPTTLSLEQPSKTTGDSVPLLAPVRPLHQKLKTIHCPMSPMTPDLDIDESPGSSQSGSMSSTFTFDLLSPTTPRHDHGFSFTVCPSSPLDESMVYAFPPRKRAGSTSFQMRSRGLQADYNDLPIEFDAPLSVDPLREGMQTPSDDRKYFHVRFLQEDSPFPKTPDC